MLKPGGRVVIYTMFDVEVSVMRRKENGFERSARISRVNKDDTVTLHVDQLQGDLLGVTWFDTVPTVAVVTIGDSSYLETGRPAPAASSRRCRRSP